MLTINIYHTILLVVERRQRLMCKETTAFIAKCNKAIKYLVPRRIDWIDYFSDLDYTEKQQQSIKQRVYNLITGRTTVERCYLSSLRDLLNVYDFVRRKEARLNES